MGNYNSSSPTSLPYAAQPPAQYDQEYMRRLIATVNLLVQGKGSVPGVNSVPASLIPAAVSATVSPFASGGSSVVATITIPGAVPTNPVSVAVTPVLPAGIYAIGKVTANDTVTVEIFNQSGSSYSGTVSLSIAVIAS